MFSQSFTIGGCPVSPDSPAFIIAEAGVNHDGSLEKAKALVDSALRAGADAVKFQAFRTEQLILENVPKADYQLVGAEGQKSQSEMLRGLELTELENVQLSDYCRSAGILFLTTPFDEMSLDSLDALDLPAYKISSTDVTNLPFLRRVARKGKPILLSTGMAFMREVEDALSEIGPIQESVVVLQCCADYPAKEAEVNLNVIPAYRERFSVLTGYSDHTVGLGAAPYAVALGAKVVEKHLTLDKEARGPDHRCSLNELEFGRLVEEIRKVERYMGTSEKTVSHSERGNRERMQKSFVAAREIQIGEEFGEGNVIAKRTGGIGVSPSEYRRVFGCRATRRYQKDAIIQIP